MMGKPVIAGTRITVELILEKLAAGETIEQILRAHPHLTEEAIHAALQFAAETLRADVVYPLKEESRNPFLRNLKPTLQQSYCVFMDILGFKDLLEKEQNEQLLLDKFYLTVLRGEYMIKPLDYKGISYKFLEFPDWYIKIFTDNVVIGFPFYGP